MGERTSYPAGTFSWVDLQTDDLDAAPSASTASSSAGATTDIPIGDDCVYSMAKVHGHNVAGLGERQDESIPPHWNCYVTVEDADASAARAAELGATAPGAALRRLRRRAHVRLRRPAGRGALGLAGRRRTSARGWSTPSAP